MKIEYKPTKQSNAIGLAFLGFGILFTTIGLHKYLIGPYLRKQRAIQDQEWADYIYSKEQEAKTENYKH